MIAMTAKYVVKPGKVEAVLAALERMKPLVEAREPGCRHYQVSQSLESPDVLLLYEVYDDDAALAAHRETPHFKEIIEGEVIPLLIRRDRELFRVLIA